jgi:hypothetical protein
MHVRDSIANAGHLTHCIDPSLEVTRGMWLVRAYDADRIRGLCRRCCHPSPRQDGTPQDQNPSDCRRSPGRALCVSHARSFGRTARIASVIHRLSDGGVSVHRFGTTRQPALRNIDPVGELNQSTTGRVVVRFRRAASVWVCSPTVGPTGRIDVPQCSDSGSPRYGDQPARRASRLSAPTTARSEAVTIDSFMPTPHRTCVSSPVPSSVST